MESEADASEEEEDGAEEAVDASGAGDTKKASGTNEMTNIWDGVLGFGPNQRSRWWSRRRVGHHRHSTRWAETERARWLRDQIVQRKSQGQMTRAVSSKGQIVQRKSQGQMTRAVSSKLGQKSKEERETF